MNVEQKVKEIICAQLEVSPEQVKPEASFTDDLKADSLAVVELVLALEEQFGMTSDLFSQQFQRGELGDDEAFFRWYALVEMQRRVAQRLALLLADSTT